MTLVQLQPIPFVGAPQFSQEHLALEFANRHANKLRYVALWNKWLWWDGNVWHHDETRKVFTLARELCREYANQVSEKRQQKEIASAKTRAAVVSLAGEDLRLVATIDQWDADPWLLNTPGGVVDLRTGEMRPHRIEDYMTKITAVAPSNDDCLLWKDHLKKVFNCEQEKDDQANINYLQRLSGYFLTGITREHSLHYCWGRGRNGKGTTINTFAAIMNDYHESAPTEMFIATKSERHPTDLASLRGARLVTASETEKGQRWAESKIKMLTGDDPIKARFMRQDFFEYHAQFKICISGNHKPGLRTVDDAIKARMHLLPFLRFLQPEERVLDLKDQLKTEWGGILRWMIEGCAMWLKDGLKPPSDVTTATNEYMDNADILGSWFAEACENTDFNSGLFTIQLYGSYEKFAKDRGEFVMPMREFSTELADRAAALNLRKTQHLQRMEGTEKKVGAGFLGVAWRSGRPEKPM